MRHILHTFIWYHNILRKSINKLHRHRHCSGRKNNFNSLAYCVEYEQNMFVFRWFFFCWCCWKLTQHTRLGGKVSCTTIFKKSFRCAVKIVLCYYLTQNILYCTIFLFLFLLLSDKIFIYFCKITKAKICLCIGSCMKIENPLWMDIFVHRSLCVLNFNFHCIIKCF